MSTRRVALALGALSSVIACSEPLEFADWTIPVPEGTPVVEYANATDDEREGNHIELIQAGLSRF